MKKGIKTLISVTSVSWVIATMLGGSAPSAHADAPQSEAGKVTIIYFLRHGEDVPELVNSDPSFSVTFNQCNASMPLCCVEALNPLGKVRAAVLADWFAEHKITQTLTAPELEQRSQRARFARLQLNRPKVLMPTNGR